MSLMILEVDGSIHNPAVAWGVTIWSIVITVIAFIAARLFRQNPRTPFTIFAALLGITTPIFVKIIATLFYVWPDGSFVSVHFWGMTRLQWLSPAAAVIVFLCFAFWPQRHVAAV